MWAWFDLASRFDFCPIQNNRRTSEPVLSSRLPIRVRISTDLLQLRDKFFSVSRYLPRSESISDKRLLIEAAVSSEKLPAPNYINQ
jgi:hypothetical protein